MKINISYTNPKYYPNIKSLRYWLFYFKKYRYVKGFILRIFGVYFNIREKNASLKLITIARSSQSKINL